MSKDRKVYCRLPIANCRFEKSEIVLVRFFKSAIGNRQSAINLPGPYLFPTYSFLS
jgi:hypothetical protein